MSPPRAKLLALLLATLTGTSALAAGNFFCCNDASGKQVCGDILPQACYGRAYRELGSNGQTIRTVDAPLTAEQRSQREAEEEKRKREEEKRKEQQRKDQALLNTYGNEQDIELMRKRAEGDVLKAIANAEKKIVEIRQQRKKFENEAEFYKKKTLPHEVQKGLADADSDINSQEVFIAEKKKELEGIRAKYDEDKRRFVELISQRPPKR
ncbi:MAG: hypothetical protein KBG62_06670 [Propionivibrio sp.]|nr:hypothetical protein [Propionivibrio sp.]